MGKCRLNPASAIDALQENLADINPENIVEILANASATYADGLQYLAGEVSTPEGLQAVKDFINETFEGIIINTDNEWSLNEDFDDFMQSVISNEEKMDAFTDDLVAAISVEAGSSTVTTVAAEPISEEQAYTMSEYTEQALEDIASANGADSETGSKSFPQDELEMLFNPSTTGREFMVMLNTVYLEPEAYTPLYKTTALSSTVVPERVIIDDFFYNLKDYYEADFLPFINSIIKDEFLNHIKDPKTQIPDGNEVIAKVKERLRGIGDSKKIVFEDVRAGLGTDTDRRVLYSYASLKYMDTILHNNVKYLVADGKGNYILNVKNLRARTTFVANKGKVDSYQVSDMIDGFLTSSFKLEYKGLAEDGNRIYTTSDKSPYITANDRILVQQYLQREVTTRLAANGKSVTLNNVIEEFKDKIPGKGSPQAEQILHSIIVQFFAPDTNYYIINPVTQVVEPASSLRTTDHLPNIVADEIIDTITDSIGSLLLSAGINIKVNIRNGTPRISSGLKAMNVMHLSKEMVNVMVDPRSKDRYLLTNKILSIKEDPTSSSGFILNMKVGKNTFPFKFDTGLGGMRLNAGAQPSPETIDMLKSMLYSTGDNGWTSRDVIAMMSILRLPNGMAMNDFVGRYTKYTVGNINPALKLEYILPNIALMLALNISSNESVYKKLHPISDSDIDSLYSYTISDEDLSDNPMYTAGQSLKYNPFKALIRQTNAIDKVLSDMNGVNKSNLIRDLGSGWEFVSNPISPSQEVGKNIAMGQSSDQPHGTMPSGFSVDIDTPSLVRGSTMIGDQIKTTDRFNAVEHFDSVINGPFLGILADSQGNKAAFPAGSQTDTGRPQAIVINRDTARSGYGFLPKIFGVEADTVKKEAVNYHTEYYGKMRYITLTRWGTMLAQLGHNSVALAELTTLEKLNTYIIDNNITLDEVSKHMTKELDYVVRNENYVAIKSEYIYLAEEIFAAGRGDTALKFLEDGYKSFKRSKGYRNFKVSYTNRKFMEDYLSQGTLKARKAKEVAGFGFYWRAIMMRDVFRRATSGDIISFQGSIDRTFEDDYLEMVEDSKDIKGSKRAQSAEDIRGRLREYLIKQSLQAMMVDQAKRLSGVGTGSARIRLKSITEDGELEQGSYLHAYNPSTEEGGVHILTFEEIKSDARDILGAREDAKGSPFDGVQWMHQLFALQADKGNMDSHRSLDGSAFKYTAMSNNGYGIRYMKSSMQNVFTYSNLRKSATLRALHKVMNTSVPFQVDANGNTIPVEMKLPPIIFSDRKGIRSASVMSLRDDLAITVKISNMHDLYMHFGAESGNSIYNGMSSWEFIHSYLLSGRYDTGVPQLSREWTNKYIGFAGDESAIKTGNNKINRGSIFDINISSADVETDIFDPHNLGSILNSGEDIENTENEGETTLKVSTQVMRIIGTNSNNTLEAEVVRVTQALLADVGYEKRVSNKVFDSAVKVLLNEVGQKTIEDTKLSIELYRRFATFLEDWQVKGQRDGTSLYNELREIVEEGGDDLNFMASDIFMKDMVVKGLENIDPSVAQAFLDGDLTYDSKQVENEITTVFKSEVNKATIKQTFKGSHVVLGPSHGMIPLYNVFIDNSFAISMTQEEYSRHPKMPFRVIVPADAAKYRPFISMDTMVESIDPDNSEATITESIGEKVYDTFAKYGGVLEVLFQDEVDVLLEDFELVKFKIPDIDQSRDLEYAHYIKKALDPNSGIVSIEKADSQRNVPITDSAAFNRLTETRGRTRNFQPISANRRFESKNEITEYIDSNFGMIKEGSLFAVDNKVFRYVKGRVVQYKNYVKESRYSETEFNMANLEITYEDYRNSRLSTEDTNNQIHRALVNYARSVVQETLNEEIKYVEVTTEEFGTHFIELQDIYGTEEDFQEILEVLEREADNPVIKNELMPGYYMVNEEIRAVNVSSLGNILEVGEVQIEDKWLFQPMEVVQSPHYKDQFFIDDNTTLIDFFGDVDYSKVSRIDALHYYEKAIMENDWNIYTENAPNEFKVLYDKFYDLITQDTKWQKKSKSYKVFHSHIFKAFKQQGEAVEGIELLENEYKTILTHLKNSPEFSPTLEFRKEFIEDEIKAEERAHERYQKEDEAYQENIKTVLEDQKHAIELQYQKVLRLREIEKVTRTERLLEEYAMLLSSNLQEYIENRARLSALSFNGSLEMFSTRIPSQDMQSFTKAVITSFNFGSGNTVFSPLDLIIISGADYDIDKLFNMIYYISSSGELAFLESLNIPDLLVDGKPDKEILKRYIDGEVEIYAAKAFKRYDTIEEATQAISKYRQHILNDVSGKAKNHMLRDLFKTVVNPANATRSQTLISTETLNERVNKNITGIEPLELNAFDLSSDFKLDEEGGSGQGMIGFVANAGKVYSLVYTAAVKTELMQGGIGRFGPESILDNYLSKFDTPMSVKDILAEHDESDFGTEVVAGNPNGEFQLFFGTDRVNYKVYTGQVAGNIDKNSTDYKGKISRINEFRRRTKAEELSVEQEITTFMREFEYLGLDTDFSTTLGDQLETWELFSELLSAATDNAKLLLFKRLNLNYTSIGLVHTLLTMGFDLSVAFDFIQIATIKNLIDEVVESTSILDRESPKFLKGVLNHKAKWKSKKTAIYSKESRKVTSGTAYFSKATTNYNKTNLTQFELDMRSDKPDMVKIVGKIKGELTSPIMQLTNVLNIQDSLGIVKRVAQVTQGMHSKDFDVRSEINLLEYRIIQRLQGLEEDSIVDREALDGSGDFNLDRFFTEPGYKDGWINALADSDLIGYNFLEIIAQNPDIYEYKAIQSKTQKQIAVVQKTAGAADQLFDIIKNTGMAEIFETPTSYGAVKSLIDDIIVNDYFQNNSDYKNVQIPGVEGVFNLLEKEGRRSFLHNIRGFHEYLQERSRNSSSTDDSNYHNNLFINTLSVTHESTRFEEAPVYLNSPNMTESNFNEGQLSRMRDGVQGLDPEDQFMLETYSLLVNKSTKSLKSFERFIKFANIGEYNRHKSKVLHTPGMFDELLGRIHPVTLLMNVRNLVLNRSTETYEKTSYDEYDQYDDLEFGGQPRKTEGDYMNFEYIEPEFTLENGGVYLIRSQQTGTTYAAVDKFKELLPGTNGMFPVEKNFGFQNMGFNSTDSGSFTGLELLLESGASPYAIKYKVKGQEDLADGFILGIEKDGPIFTDSNFEVDYRGMAHNEYADIIELNDHLKFDGKYIGRKSPSELVKSVEGDVRTDDVINKDNVQTLIWPKATKKALLSGATTRIVFPVNLRGNISEGDVIDILRYNGGKARIIYEGQRIVQSKDGFSDKDISRYKGMNHHVLKIEIDRGPYALYTISPDRMGDNLHPYKDRFKFQNILKGDRRTRSSANGVVWGNTDFIALTDAQHAKVDNATERVSTLLEDTNGANKQWFAREFFGSFSTVAELAAAIKEIKPNLPINDSSALFKELSIMFNAKYSPEIKSFLKNAGTTINIYSFNPIKARLVTYDSALKKINGKEDLVLPEDFQMRADVNFSSEIANFVSGVSGVTFSPRQIKEVESDPSISPVISQQIMDDTIRDINIIINNDSDVITENDIDNSSSNFVSKGVQLDGSSAIILKVKEITKTMSSKRVSVEDTNLDTHEGVSVQGDNRGSAIDLMYLKKLMHNRYSEIPLIVYESEARAFSLYNSDSGIFTPVLEGIPNVGDNPTILGFQSMDPEQSKADIEVVEAIIKQRANYDDDMNNYIPREYIYDQDLIPLAESPTAAMTKVSKSNQGPQAISSVTQLVNMPGVTFHIEEGRLIDDLGKAATVAISSDRMTIVGERVVDSSQEFADISEVNSLAEGEVFTVSTFAEDGVVMIESTSPSKFGLSASIETFALFPDEKTRIESYGNYTGKGRRRYLTGTILDDKGQPIKVSFENVYKTNKESLIRRDLNADDRLELHQAKKNASDYYVEKVRPIYNDMLKSNPDFRTYVANEGGPKVLFNRIDSPIFLHKVATDFKNLVQTSGAGLSQLGVFKQVYSIYAEKVSEIREMQKEYRTDLVEKYRSKQVTTLDKDPYEINVIDPTTETVIMFSDQNMTTVDVSRGNTANLVEYVKGQISKNASQFTYDESKKAKGGYLLNVFGKGKNDTLRFLRNSKSFGKYEINRVVRMLTNLNERGLDSIYISFPELNTPISDNTDILYEDLARLLTQAIEKMGFVPKALKVSDNLSQYIQRNSGLTNISDIKLSQKIETTNETDRVIEPVQFNYLMPTQIFMANGRTVLEEVNHRKGISLNTSHEYAKPANDTWLLQSKNSKDILIDVYKDYLRENPHQLVGIVKTVNKNSFQTRPVLVRKRTQPIEQLIEAVNSIAFDLDIATARPIDLGVHEISATGIDYKLINPAKFTSNGLGVTVGTRSKTQVDGFTYVAEIIGNGEDLTYVDAGGTLVRNQERVEELGLDGEDIQSLLSFGKESLIIKLYRDPSTHIASGDFEDMVGRNLGDEVAVKLQRDFNIVVDPMTIDVLNKGDVPMVMDISVPFGRDGKGSFIGENYFNKIKTVTKNLLYTNDLKDDTVISIVGTVLGNLDTDRARYTSYDVKQYLNLHAELLDNYIVKNKLSVAIGNRPGIEQELRARLLAKPGYNVAEDGIIRYNPTTTLITDDSPHIIIKTLPYKAFNLNNGKTRIGNISGKLATINAVSEDNQGGKSVLPAKGKFIDYRYTGDLESMSDIHSTAKYYESFWKSYGDHVSDTAAKVPLGRNNDFIRQVITHLVGGNISEKQELVNSMVDRVIDADGNLLVYSSKIDRYLTGHAALQYAVARNKHNALMLIENNLQKDLDFSKLTVFINEQLQEDKASHSYRDNNIHTTEYNDVVNSTKEPSNFELMLYDIVASKSKNIRLNLKPDQEFFFSKMLELGEQGFTDKQYNKEGKFAPVYRIFDTANIQHMNNITGVVVDSNPEAEYLLEPEAQAEVKKFSQGLYRHLTSVKTYKYDLSGENILMNIEGENSQELTAYTLYGEVQRDIIRDLYKRIKFDVNEVYIDKIIEGGFMKNYLSKHIYRSPYGTSLLDTLFFGRQLSGIAPITAKSEGKVSTAVIDGTPVNGIMLVAEGEGKIFVTEFGSTYRVTLDLMGREITGYDLITGKGFDPQQAVEFQTVARPSYPGHVYSRIDVDGVIIDQKVRIVETSNTNQLVATVIESGAILSYNDDTQDWSPVLIGEDFSDDMFITAQTPEHMGEHTKYIAASGQLFKVAGVTVKGEIATTSDGWVYEYNSDTKLFTVKPKGTSLPTSERSMMQKEAIKLKGGTDYRSRQVNNKVLLKVVRHLSEVFGVNAETMTSVEIEDEFGGNFADSFGFTFGGRIIINKDKATLDTPLHEFGHFYFRQLRDTDPELFEKLKGEAFNSSIAESMRLRYSELGPESDDMAEEILTSMLGIVNQQKVLESADRGILERFMDTLRSWFNSMFGVKDKKYDFDLNSSLADVMDQIGTQLLYGPRSILNDMTSNEKGFLNNLMTKTITDKEAIDLLKARGFILEVC